MEDSLQRCSLIKVSAEALQLKNSRMIFNRPSEPMDRDKFEREDPVDEESIHTSI